MPLKLVLYKRICVLHSVYFSNLLENSNGHHFSTGASSTGAKSNRLLAPVLVEFFSSTGASVLAICYYHQYSARNTKLEVQFTVLLASDKSDMSTVIGAIEVTSVINILCDRREQGVCL